MCFISFVHMVILHLFHELEFQTLKAESVNQKCRNSVCKTLITIGHQYEDSNGLCQTRHLTHWKSVQIVISNGAFPISRYWYGRSPSDTSVNYSRYWHNRKKRDIKESKDVLDPVDVIRSYSDELVGRPTVIEIIAHNQRKAWVTVVQE